MALRDIATWLVDLSGFRERAQRVVIDSVCGELGSTFVRLAEHSHVEHDWRYLLLAASVLAQSEDGRCQATALRLAQACLCDEGVTETQKDAAALILDALANHPSIRLAEHRRLLKPSFADRLPGAARVEFTNRLHTHSIEGEGDTHLRVNRFQHKLWDHVMKDGWVSVSAPTSAGKSFILARWIVELNRGSTDMTVVYVVPTRALISQVERDLRCVLDQYRLYEVAVSSIPIVKADPPARKRVFVLTQERLHILLLAHVNLRVHALIVDEAHKVGDRQRGVLLQDVVERVHHESPDVRVVFASPMTSNPKVLLQDARAGTERHAFASEDVTVTQNLFWVSQRPGKPKIWEVSLCAVETNVMLGEIQLAAKPSSESKRLSFVAHAVGGATHGNIVYVNGPAEAEKIAKQLFDLIGVDVSGDGAQDLRELVELTQHVVHKRFALATCLRRGVAFHYGNMPLLIREEIERLFTLGTIKFLVCTSTLIEGVNMACRNIFMRGPQKGRGRRLTGEDFWNLAGRAGRWGKEFQGNVFCIDPEVAALWGESGPPRTRTRQPIRRTTDDVLAEAQALVEFIKGEAPAETAKKRPEFEYVFAYFASIHIKYGGLQQAPWSDRYDPQTLESVAGVVKIAIDGLDVEPSVISRNPGISPFALNQLLLDFRVREKPVEELIPTDPSDWNAARRLTGVFGRLSRRACPRLGPEGPRVFVLALLVTQWMRGYPLSRLIEERIGYLERKGEEVDLAAQIRSVMDEVEQIARFEAPRGLSCYCDVLSQHFRELGRDDLLSDLPQFNLLLELGVNQQTQVSLVGLGLSRTSAILISDSIAADDLSEIQVLEWLLANEELWKNFSVPLLIKREIERIVQRHALGDEIGRQVEG
ncbi:MAG: DEAD/DEAH box helicase [Deltaproteobacteria bacterium]|nr:DEAD/DEAH box helicase [Deltaproteobacteria bacterium]